MIWGPASPEASLRDRIARYISAPLSPVEVRELPCDVSFRHCPEAEWEIGPARIRAASVTHRGPTLGYRIDDGGSSLAYIPDHEPALGADLGAARGGVDLRLRARPRRLAADPRRPVLRRASTPTTSAGATRRSATRSASPTAPAPSAPSSSTTTRPTPTTSSTGSGPKRGERWAELGGDPARGRARRRGRRATSCRRGRRRRIAPRGDTQSPDRAVCDSASAARCRPTGAASSRIERAADRSPLVRAASRRPAPPTPARSATAAAACPTSSTRSPSPARLDEHGYGDEVLAAALLHDVVEDSETSVEELREEFGERVAGLVAALSDDESIDDYRERKDEHRARVRRHDGDAFAIYGSDKLTNSSTLHALARSAKATRSATSSRCRWS